MAIIKHISVKNRFYSDAVEYLTCKFDEYTNKPILDEKGRLKELIVMLILLEQSALKQIDCMARIIR